MPIKNILVTGSKGQLGSEMQIIASSNKQYHFLFADKEELPIDSIEAIKEYFGANKIDACVNCAAYTAVDKAETEKEKAYLVNADAAANLAAVCKEHQALFIHISTDYVFDGTATAPYKEDHPVKPVNTYGASKLKGEDLVLENNPGSIIIRTSWVYSSFGNNFVKTMLRLMNERESISVVNDQEGCPTYAADLAAAIIKIIDQSVPGKIKNGIYNFSNKGVINWFQFATAIRELTSSTCIVHPIPSSHYPTPARRPNYSVLDTSKIQETFDIEIPEWKKSLKKCLQILRR